MKKMPDSNDQTQPTIDKRDFDTNRPLRRDAANAGPDEGGEQQPETRPSADSSRRDSNDGLLSDVVEEIVERDRQNIAKEVVRVGSFAWGVVSCLGAGGITAFSLYGPLLLTHLHYTQLRINAVSIAAEISMYLPVPLFGYLCDRYSPSPLSLFSGLLFGAGYLLAAFTYKSGPPPDAGGSGWPFWVMVVAFIAIGTATSCLYLAAVTTCAKNFGRGKHKGIMLAVPIAGFGLAGMWQSQVGTYLLYEQREDGSRGDVDVFKYFLFLAVLLLGIGVIGTFGLRIVDGEEEEKHIDEAVEELERSGLLGDRTGEPSAAYGTFSSDQRRPQVDGAVEGDEGPSLSLSDEEREERRREKKREEEEQKKKNWLLNAETRLFLKDRTMWWLALGFFLVTGPGEAYINNLGTIIQTLTPQFYPPNAPPPAGLSSTHVTTVALTSTIARLLTGSLSDFFAPQADHLNPTNSEEDGQLSPNSAGGKGAHPTLSRMIFLLPSACLLALGYLLLASPLPLHNPSLSHISTALIGFGYGSSFSLVPIIISVVWGVENFGTNWGIVAMVPAGGAAVWGLIYSSAYQGAMDIGDGGSDGQCHGWRCFGFWAVGCTISVSIAIVIWSVAWQVWRRRGVAV